MVIITAKSPFLADLSSGQGAQAIQGDFPLGKDRKGNYSTCVTCLLKDLVLKSLVILEDSILDISISGPNPQGMPCSQM